MTTTRLSDEEVHARSRALFAEADLVLAVVFLSPEAGDPPLGLTPPEYYVASRAAPLGDVPGPVVASVFGLIEPGLTARAWDGVRGRAGAAELVQSKLDMAITVLERVTAGVELPPLPRTVELLRRVVDAGEVIGHPLFAALRDQPDPPTDLGRVWRLCDAVREHRGGSHVNAFRAAGLDGAEINVLTELYRGDPIGSEASVVNGWPRRRLAAALASLAEQGYVDGEAITAEGRAFRDEIEQATSRGERSLVEAAGDDLDELLALLRPLARAVAKGLPPPYWWHTWKPA